MVQTVTFDNNGAIARLKTLAEPISQEDVRTAVKHFLEQDRAVNTYPHSTTYDLILHK